MATPDDKPDKLPNFMYLLSQTTSTSLPEVRNVVAKMIETRSFAQTLGYYEIRGEPMLRALIDHVVQAVDKKMTTDFEAHRLGSTSFQRVIYEAVAFALIVGAQLAKERRV